MTNREFYNAVINANVAEDITVFAQTALDKLDSRNEKRRTTENDNQKKNNIIKEAILASMEPTTTYTAAAIVELGIEGCASTQKASSLMRQLVADGKVTSADIPVKGKGKVKGYTVVAE